MAQILQIKAQDAVIGSIHSVENLILFVVGYVVHVSIQFERFHNTWGQAPIVSFFKNCVNMISC